VAISRSGGGWGPPGAASNDFSTSFPTVESPISQNSIWTNGLATGLDWNNMKVISAGCVGAADMPAPNRYSDNIAHLKSSYRAFSANQWAQGTAYKASGYTGNGGGHEIELLLRFSITANDAHGYEVLRSLGASGGIAVVRWNGAAGSYTSIYEEILGTGYSDGDVIYAQIVGNIITVKINGTIVPNFGSIDVSSVGSTWDSGQPGVGAWPVDGGQHDNAGWKNFSAGNL
jgi:hypothetical protein